MPKLLGDRAVLAALPMKVQMLGYYTGVFFILLPRPHTTLQSAEPPSPLTSGEPSNLQSLLKHNRQLCIGCNATHCQKVYIIMLICHNNGISQTRGTAAGHTCTAVPYLVEMLQQNTASVVKRHKTDKDETQGRV